MQAASDLEIVEYVFDESGKSDIYDLILCGREVADVNRPPEGAPMLLVRILQCNNDATRRRYSTIGHLEQYIQNVRWPNKGSGRRLVIPSYSKTPDYKIMLYPHRHGEELPVARWLDRIR